LLAAFTRLPHTPLPTEPDAGKGLSSLMGVELLGLESDL
jgi:hypothetical protein